MGPGSGSLEWVAAPVSSDQQGDPEIFSRVSGHSGGDSGEDKDSERGKPGGGTRTGDLQPLQCIQWPAWVASCKTHPGGVGLGTRLHSSSYSSMKSSRTVSASTWISESFRVAMVNLIP